MKITYASEPEGAEGDHARDISGFTLAMGQLVNETETRY